MNAIETAQYFMTINVSGRTHVIREFVRNDPTKPEPNYKGSGMALVGVLEPGQSLDDFKDKWVKSEMFGSVHQIMERKYRTKRNQNDIKFNSLKTIQERSNSYLLIFAGGQKRILFNIFNNIVKNHYRKKKAELKSE